MSTSKRCWTCGETKPIDNFRKNRRIEDGRSGQCKACSKLSDAQYRRNNKAKIRERWRADPEYREERRAYSRAYYAANRESMLAAAAAYLRTPEGKAAQARANSRRRALTSAAENTLTAEEWQGIIAEQGNRCTWCGCEFTNDDPPARDHIIPVTKGGGLTRENVQALHKSCNSRKGSK